MLLTLEDAKAQLDIETARHDVELLGYVEALTAPIERLVGPVEHRTVVEIVDAGGSRIALSQVPVAEVTSLTQLATGATTEPDGLLLDGDAGVLRRWDGSPFFGGPWRVEYTAGRGEVPPTIRLAALILLQHLWRTQNGSARGMGGADDYAVTEPIPGFGYAIPNRVLQLLEAYRVPPGVA
ncbi:hypothetical protein [Streptomyces albidoflavus]|uniref:hypothetical protein n=1 Tax=Streptomyces albidoflavus TaxID=1886 RepID=UPI0033DB2C0B